MKPGSLKEISNYALFAIVKNLRGGECQTIAEIIRHIAEMDERAIYRDAGYPSLFKYLTDELGYSEGSAARRCRAVKCYRESPDTVYEMLASGKVTLSSLAEVTPAITQENREGVLRAVQGTTRQEAQRVAVSFGAPVVSKKASIKAKKVVVVRECSSGDLFGSVQAMTEVVEEKYGISFDVSPEVKALFEEARALIGHYDVAVVFEKLVKSYLGKKKGSRVKKPKSTNVATVRVGRRARKALPEAVKREVRERDNCQCTFRSSDGRRCSEKVGLQFDHIVPVARGGGNEVENIRLLCRAHNQLAAEEVFGTEFISALRQRKNVECDELNL